MANRKIDLPKSVYVNRVGNFGVQIYSKESKRFFNVGTFSSLEEAVKNRDLWLCSNYDKVNGYLPRGITFKKKTSHYNVYIPFRKTSRTPEVLMHIGVFKTLKEAVDYRRKFILGLL